jgi:hypothetical protein
MTANLPQHDIVSWVRMVMVGKDWWVVIPMVVQELVGIV